MPKKFNFSLQKTLEVRQHLEDMQAIEVLRSREELKKEEKKLNALKQKKNTMMEFQY